MEDLYPSSFWWGKTLQWTSSISFFFFLKINRSLFKTKPCRSSEENHFSFDMIKLFLSWPSPLQCDTKCVKNQLTYEIAFLCIQTLPDASSKLSIYCWPGISVAVPMNGDDRSTQLVVFSFQFLEVADHTSLLIPKSNHRTFRIQKYPTEPPSRHVSHLCYIFFLGRTILYTNSFSSVPLILVKYLFSYFYLLCSFI